MGDDVIKRLQIEQLREQRGWTITYLSNVSGISRATLSEIKHKQKKKLTPNQENKLAKAFGVPKSELYVYDFNQ